MDRRNPFSRATHDLRTLDRVLLRCPFLGNRWIDAWALFPLFFGGPSQCLVDSAHLVPGDAADGVAVRIAFDRTRGTSGQRRPRPVLTAHQQYRLVLGRTRDPAP